MAEPEEKKLSWMYGGLSGHVDKEEYLTGRKIDKTFELVRDEEAIGKGDLEVDGDVVPRSVLGMASNGSTITVDMAAKIREDPLYEIRKKEFEKRREILDNPLKVKKIKDMLKRTLAGSSSDSDQTDSDDERAKKRRHRDKKKRRHRSRSGDRKSRQSKSSRDKRKRSASPTISSRHYGHSSRDDRRDASSSSSSRKDEKRSEHRKEEVSKAIRHDKEKEIEQREKSPNNMKKSRKPAPIKYQRPDRKKLTPQEIEQKRLEMMGDADRRETERADKVRMYKEQEEKEKDEATSGKPAGFIKEQMTRAANEASLESTLKQKAFKSQSGRSMDTNFARK